MILFQLDRLGTQCKGVECNSIPLISLKGKIECTVCGGTGTGVDGAYQVEVDDSESAADTSTGSADDISKTETCSVNDDESDEESLSETCTADNDFVIESPSPSETGEVDDAIVEDNESTTYQVVDDVVEDNESETDPADDVVVEDVEIETDAVDYEIVEESQSETPAVDDGTVEDSRSETHHAADDAEVEENQSENLAVDKSIVEESPSEEDITLENRVIEPSSFSVDGVVEDSSLDHSELKPRASEHSEVKVGTSELILKSNVSHADTSELQDHREVIGSPRISTRPSSADYGPSFDECPVSPTGSATRSVSELKEDFESKRNYVSKEIGRKMMQGWMLLDMSCPECMMPLLSDPQIGQETCVLCGPTTTLPSVITTLPKLDPPVHPPSSDEKVNPVDPPSSDEELTAKSTDVMEQKLVIFAKSTSASEANDHAVVETVESMDISHVNETFFEPNEEVAEEISEKIEEVVVETVESLDVSHVNEAFFELKEEDAASESESLDVSHVNETFSEPTEEDAANESEAKKKNTISLQLPASFDMTDEAVLRTLISLVKTSQAAMMAGNTEKISSSVYAAAAGTNEKGLSAESAFSSTSMDNEDVSHTMSMTTETNNDEEMNSPGTPRAHQEVNVSVTIEEGCGVEITRTASSHEAFEEDQSIAYSITRRTVESPHQTEQEPETTISPRRFFEKMEPTPASVSHHETREYEPQEIDVREDVNSVHEESQHITREVNQDRRCSPKVKNLPPRPKVHPLTPTSDRSARKTPRGAFPRPGPPRPEDFGMAQSSTSARSSASGHDSSPCHGYSKSRRVPPFPGSPGPRGRGVPKVIGGPRDSRDDSGTVPLGQ